jgi:hypothetical protein
LRIGEQSRYSSFWGCFSRRENNPKNKEKYLVPCTLWPIMAQGWKTIDSFMQT